MQGLTLEYKILKVATLILTSKDLMFELKQKLFLWLILFTALNFGNDTSLLDNLYFKAYHALSPIFQHFPKGDVYRKFKLIIAIVFNKCSIFAVIYSKFGVVIWQYYLSGGIGCEADYVKKSRKAGLVRSNVVN